MVLIMADISAIGPKGLIDVPTDSQLYSGLKSDFHHQMRKERSYQDQLQDSRLNC